MISVLLILFPVAMSATCYVLRRQTELVILAGIAVTLTQITLVLQLPLNEPVRLLGMTLALNRLTQLFLVVFLSTGICAFIASWHLPHGENFVPIALLILGLVGAILLLQDPFLVALLLVAAGLISVLAVVDLPTGAGVLIETRVIATAIKYLVLMVLAGTLIYFGFVLFSRPGDVQGRIPLTRLMLALIMGGFALRLGLIPFHSWLIDLVEDTAPLVSFLVIAIMNVTALLVLMQSFQRFPILLVENQQGLTVLRYGSVLTGVLGGLLAVHQQSMRRTLAYVLVYNMGMVCYGLLSVSPLGLSAALFEALNMVLAVLLICVSLGLLEQPDGRPAAGERRDLLRRWPVAGVGLLGGCLALLGLPPLSGFASKMLLYQQALNQSWLELMLLILATLLAGLALARLTRDRLIGPGEDIPSLVVPLTFDEPEVDTAPPRRLPSEAWSTALLTVLLLGICLGIGLYPQPVLNVIGDVVDGLTFVRLL